VKKIAVPSLAQWLATPVGPKKHRTFRVRLLVQVAFAVTCLVIGYQLSRFYLAARAGAHPLPRRPPGAEGFLPISGLMGILDWAYQGALNRIHPAATILVILALLSAILLRKSFCSWVCPVGFISEGLARAGRKLFGRNFQVWPWLDRALQSLKYLLMAFFVWAIFSMSAEALQAFIQSPYNKVADVKMGLFFVNLGQVGISVMAVLVVGSVFIQGLWCRYLCPYGALLGLFSWMSPVRIQRTADSCIDCSLCDQACMARLPISRLDVVRSVECTGCVDCLAVCPVNNTLELAAGPKRLGVSTYAAAVVLLFLLGTVAARMTGVWHNGITDQEYVQRFQGMERPEYAHPGAYEPSDRADQ
jgi:polyferredoxin